MTPVTTTPTFSVAYLEALRHVQCQMVAALSLLVWDLFLTLEEEVEHIWQMRRCMLKWFYFYFRYLLLAAQIFHLAVMPSLSSGHTTDFLCKMWYRYMICILHTSSCMIEIVLVTRVYALYNRSRKVGVFLGGLILVESALSGSNIVRCSATEYFEACILPFPRKDVANPLASITVVVQSIIMGMILFKHFVGIRLGWGRTPLLSVLVRDATSFYLLMFVLYGIALVLCGLDDLRIAGMLYWSTSLYSAVGCRLILNMERFARENSSDEEFVLTSHISL